MQGKVGYVGLQVHALDVNSGHSVGAWSGPWPDEMGSVESQGPWSPGASPGALEKWRERQHVHPFCGQNLGKLHRQAMISMWIGNVSMWIGNDWDVQTYIIL